MSKKSTKTDLARIDRMTDKDIGYSDIPALDNSFFTRPTVEWPPAKQQVTVRLDKDVLNGGVAIWVEAVGSLRRW